MQNLAIAGGLQPCRPKVENIIAKIHSLERYVGKTTRAKPAKIKKKIILL